MKPGRWYRILKAPITFWMFARYFRENRDPRWLQQAAFYTKFTL